MRTIEEVRQDRADRVAAHDHASDEQADEGFASRLKQLVAIAGTASALARKAGISPAGLSRYLNGGDPSRRVLLALARATGVQVGWLACGEGPMMKDEASAGIAGSSLTLLPYYTLRNLDGDEVSTNTRQDFTSQAFCYRWLNSKGLNSQHLAVMQVRGDSMSPTLNSGDMALIDTAAREVEDDRIYLMENSGNLLLRRLQIEIGGRLRALADNPLHREFVVSADEITVHGRVVWRGALL